MIKLNMTAIASVNRVNRGIGCNGGLLVRIPDDMRRFRKTTMNGVVVMGRRTFESLPGGKPLDKRLNIVLTSRELSIDGVITCDGLPSLFSALALYSHKRVFAIGGQAVYKQLLPYCRFADITSYTARSGGEPDAFFPALKAEDGWRLVESSPEASWDGVAFLYERYENQKAIDWLL